MDRFRPEGVNGRKIGIGKMENASVEVPHQLLGKTSLQLRRPLFGQAVFKIETLRRMRRDHAPPHNERTRTVILHLADRPSPPLPDRLI